MKWKILYVLVCHSEEECNDDEESICFKSHLNPLLLGEDLWDFQSLFWIFTQLNWASYRSEWHKKKPTSFRDQLFILLFIDTQCCCKVFCSWRHSRLCKDWWWVLDKYTRSIHDCLLFVRSRVKPFIQIRSTFSY